MRDLSLQELLDAVRLAHPDYYAANYALLEAMQALLIALAQKAGAE